MAIAEKELKAFIQLAEQRHFQRASAQLHITSSALSRLIQRLEQRLDATLFYRDKRSVRLSAAGEHFYDYAQRALAEWEALQQMIQSDQQQLKGRVSLYCSVTAAYSILTRLLPLFNQHYPEIEVQLHTGDPAQALERLLEGQDELVIAAQPKRLSSNILYREVARARLVLIIPKRDGKVRKQWLDGTLDSAQQPWIVPETGIVRDQFDRWMKTQTVRPQIYNEVSGHEAIVSMVSLGFGIGLVPDIVLAHSPQKNHIEMVEERMDIEPFSIGLCIQKNSLKKSADQCLVAIAGLEAVRVKNKAVLNCAAAVGGIGLIQTAF